jgi:succinate-semialdehyde dehydrogenase/glutarate-semialdehyde dehydrogenase
LASTANLDEALAAAERAWPEWRAHRCREARVILHKTASLLRERAERSAAC